MNYLCDRYFETKDDINNVLSYLHKVKPLELIRMTEADDKVFELFEIELFVLSHLDDQNLSKNDLEVLFEFVKSPDFSHDFKVAIDSSLNALQQVHKDIGHLFDFELSFSAQKLKDIAFMFDELDKLVQKQIQAKRRSLH